MLRECGVLGSLFQPKDYPKICASLAPLDLIFPYPLDGPIVAYVLVCLY